MKKLFLIVTTLVSVSFAVNAQTLPKKVTEYLKSNYPNWTIKKFNKVEYQENKSVAIGDFNGDGQTDYAVVITKDNRIYTLALLATKKSYKAINLEAQTSDEEWLAGIGITKKGEKLDVFNDQNDLVRSFRLKTDGIYIYDGEGHGGTYYWQTDKFLFTREY